MITREKSFRLGGLYPAAQGSIIPDDRLWNATLPGRAIVPLQLPGLEPAVSLVKSGDHVREGMMIASAGPRGIPVHSPLPGVVREISTLKLPGIGDCSAAVIDFKGSFDQLGKVSEAQPWRDKTPGEIISLIHSMGVVEPAFEQVNLVQRLRRVEAKKTGGLRILVSLIDSDPLGMTEAVVSRMYPGVLVQGISVLQHILPNASVSLVFNHKSRKGAASVRKEAHRGLIRVRAKRVSPAYPQYDYHHLLESVYGKELVPGMTAEDGGFFVVSASALLAIQKAVIHRQPMVERILTIAGGAISKPQVVKARLGTPIIELFRECGALLRVPEKIILGNSFRGFGILDLQTPLNKDYTLILALSTDELNNSPILECIQCGLCGDHCPVGIQPIRLLKMIDKGLLRHAEHEGLGLCTSCGICSSVCPSRIPLTQGLTLGKRRLHE